MEDKFMDEVAKEILEKSKLHFLKSAEFEKISSRGDSQIIKKMQLFHNYFRPHMGLKGKTPAEAAGITVEGENPWITVIQNASKKGAEK